MSSKGKHKTEKRAREREKLTWASKAAKYEWKSGEHVKIDEGLGLLFGYAMVSKINGEENVDLHDDYIPEDAMLEAATEFMRGPRILKEIHTGNPIGKVLFAFPVTEDISASLGWVVEKNGISYWSQASKR